MDLPVILNEHISGGTELLGDRTKMYDQLRSMILEACSDSYVCVADVTFDALYVPPTVKPWLEKLKKGDRTISQIIREFVRSTVIQREITVVHSGVSYPVSINKGRLADKVVSAIKNMPSKEKTLLVVERLFVCLAQLDKAFTEGQKTTFVPSELGSKHTGSWIYVKEFIDEPGIRGEVILEIEFPRPKKSPGQPTAKNRLYHVTAEGADGFDHRLQVVNENLDLKGEVEIRID